MAYNLQSLTHSIHQILHPDPQVSHVTDLEKEQLQYLFEKVTTLQQILENLPLPIYKTLKALQIEVIHESQAAEDIVDSVIRGHHTSTISRLQSYFADKKVIIGSRLLQELRKVIKKFDSLIIKAHNIKHPTPASSSITVSFRPDQDTRDTLVGLDEDIRQLQDRLTGDERELKFIPIVGMGGIGKTTLARKLYVDPLIVSHFDFVAWATISQDYDVKAIFATLLSGVIDVAASRFLYEEADSLGLALYQNLFSRRYLIVLDDVWDTNVLNKLRAFFPDRNNQSRILLTTRELDVANYVNSSNPHHQMHLLDEIESWNLFREKLLHEGEGIDPELAGFGRIIANSCKGLPLAIKVVCGLLSGSKQTKAFWKHVANDISSTTLSLVDERFSEIFSLSYDHLPHHLRPCLLYVGAFPKGTEVRVSRIKRLWAAENFLKPIVNITPEEAAEDYLEALASRNLLLVTKWKSNRKVKSYAIHDFVRDQCIRKADEEKFVVCVKYGRIISNAQKNGQSQSLRRVLVLNEKSFFVDREGARARDNQVVLHDNVCHLLSTSKLINVLDAPTMYLPAFPKELLKLVNVRYLWLHCNSFPSPISRLYNLETLIFCPGISIASANTNRFAQAPPDLYEHNDFKIPSELWELRKLRHFKLMRVVGWANFDSVLEKLQTLSGVQANMGNLIEKVPNIRKLALYLNCSSQPDISGLHKLENLKISNVSLVSGTITFPPFLAKLTLSRCLLSDNLMKEIGNLPYLQVLKLRRCYASYSVTWQWATREDGFPSLQFLEFDIDFLDRWITEDTHFPQLRHLVIRGCCSLKEIPSCIGDIPTLEIMEIDGCSGDVVASARQIREEQCNVGNDSLQVRTRPRGGRWEMDDPSSMMH